ncbi:Down syndrome cell adhesion molecule [Chionoecetes opilio]|uniref:Down syndrome cell adhesion molecule n=1 Tax=Chionoecetes opilio TaxID=41210 RepID=A0A8J4Y673_CHIOP|nr:Down syndrome cell adhesion molecule [Chionoecetes opilio]
MSILYKEENKIKTIEREKKERENNPLTSLLLLLPIFSLTLPSSFPFFPSPSPSLPFPSLPFPSLPFPSILPLPFSFPSLLPSLPFPTTFPPSLPTPPLPSFLPFPSPTTFPPSLPTLPFLPSLPFPSPTTFPPPSPSFPFPSPSLPFPTHPFLSLPFLLLLSPFPPPFPYLLPFPSSSPPFPSPRLMVNEPRSSVPPRITDSRSAVTASLRHTVEMPCAAQGFPIPQYLYVTLRQSVTQWHRVKGKVEFPVVQDGRIQQVGGSLLIRQVTASDAGRYVCVVSSSVGSERAHTSLEVWAPLTAHITPQVQTVDVGGRATFNCSPEGFPQDTITWFKVGEGVRDGRERERGERERGERERERGERERREERGERERREREKGVRKGRGRVGGREREREKGERKRSKGGRNGGKKRSKGGREREGQWWEEEERIGGNDRSKGRRERKWKGEREARAG